MSKPVEQILVTEDFEAMSRRLRPALIKFFQRRAFSHAIAEDLTQEVLLRLLRKQDLMQLNNPEGYIFEVAMNIARDYLRRGKVRQSSMQVPLDFTELRDPVPLPDETFEHREHLQRVMDALKGLPKRTQTILILSRFENMAHKDIALGLKISISSVEKHLVRGLALLKTGVAQ